MPQTSVSLYVAAFMALGGLVLVLALLVVRRRRRLLPMLALGAVTLVLVAAGTVFLIVPPRVPATVGVQSGRCPYDRLTWSNMPSDVDDFWQPCRRVARVELALTLLGGSAVTVMAAAMALKRPTTSAREQLEATASLPR